MKKLLLIALSLTSGLAFAKHADVDVYVTGKDYNAHISYYATVTTQHSARIINNTDSTKHYQVTYALCMDLSKCEIKRNDVSVDAHASWESGIQTVTNRVQYAFAGNYPYLTYTSVTGDGIEKVISEKRYVVRVTR